jgi:hypothetical protein
VVVAPQLAQGIEVALVGEAQLGGEQAELRQKR